MAARHPGERQPAPAVVGATSASATHVGRWEGNTLVVDVTNFGPKTDFRGSRESLHLVERFTAASIRHHARIHRHDRGSDDVDEPWSVRQEMKAQDEQANRIYYEPRCHEGNFGMSGMLINSRSEERAFAQGRGPDPGDARQLDGRGRRWRGEHRPARGRQLTRRNRLRAPGMAAGLVSTTISRRSARRLVVRLPRARSRPPAIHDDRCHAQERAGLRHVRGVRRDHRAVAGYRGKPDQHR